MGTAYTTKDKRVMFAEKNKSWIIDNWNYNINLINDIKLNLGELIDKEEIKIKHNNVIVRL